MQTSDLSSLTAACALKTAQNPASFRRIMLIVNPAAGQHVCVEKALRIAANAGGAIELFTCDVTHDLPNTWVSGSNSAQTYKQLLRKRRLDEVEQIAAGVRGHGVPVTVAAEWHAMSDRGITSHCAKTAPDLVIKDSSLRGTLSRSAGLRAGYALVHQVTAPVLLVHSKAWPDQPVFVAALDASHGEDQTAPLDDAIVDTSRAIAAISGGEWAVAYPNRDAHSMKRVTEDYGASVLVIGVQDSARESSRAAGATAPQILDRIDCDLLIVKVPR